MGIHNSSVCRVRPLMDVVVKDEQAFHALMKLVGKEGLSAPKFCRYDGTEGGEMRLKPSKRHLSALIAYMATKDHGAVSVANTKRRELFNHDPAVCQEALALLEEEYPNLEHSNRAWYVFEGFTAPDIFIEGEDYVIVCEGKWTEPHITTKTTHLSGPHESRSQMVRHIQGALNYTDKKVYAFYIVDKECGYLDELEKDSFALRLKKETIAIPETEQSFILNAYVGYTTWQAIENAIPEVEFTIQKENI